jgi:hypothetical protein
MARLDAAATVRDCDFDRAASVAQACSDKHLPVCRQVFYHGFTGVDEEIEKDLLQLYTVAPEIG